MFDKQEWTEDRRREELAGTKITGGLLVLLAICGAVLLIAWPTKVAALMLLAIGVVAVVAAFDSKITWGARLTSAALGSVAVYLGVRLTIWAFTGAW